MRRDDNQARPRARLRRRKRIERRRKKSRAFQSWRRAVCLRSGYHCERCGLADRERGRRIQAHHLIPRSRGGKDYVWNAAALCSGPGGCHEAVHDHVCGDWRDWIARDEVEARTIRARCDGRLAG